MDNTSASIDAALRAAVAAAAVDLGARELAAELEMDEGELSALLQGAEPPAAARRRLEIWRELWPTINERRSRDAALTILSGYFPEHRRENVRRKFSEALYHLAES